MRVGVGDFGTEWVKVFCTGTFERSLDKKSRVALPKTVKRLLTPTAEQEAIYLTPGLDQCLELHTLVTIEERAKELEGSDAKMANRKSFSRLFFAQTQPCELDSQNRVLIPQRLVDWADLSNRIVILGVGTHWEIWNEENWQTYYQHHKAAFDELASAMCDGERPQANLEQVQKEAIRVNPK